jgi:hypothetical protein
MHPILNYVEFRTNHEPYMVHGVVHGGFRNAELKIRNANFGSWPKVNCVLFY